MGSISTAGLINFYVLFTASYFVNWTYQNPKSCTVVVGEPTEVFPASKATSLEFANKTMARPHQSLPTIGTGKEEHHSRHRRSVDVVDGHASSLPQSAPSEDSSTVNMHDVNNSVNTVSLVHGVAEEITTQRDEEINVGSNNAFVSSNVNNVSVNTGNLTNNLELSTSTEPSKTPMTSTTTEHLTTETIETTSIASTTAKITTQVTNKVKETHIEYPEEINNHVNTPIKSEKDNVAYEPEDMQGDSFSLIRPYGMERLNFFKIQNQLEKIKEVLHIYSNDSTDMDKDLEKFHYDSENSGSKTTSTTNKPKITAEEATESKMTTQSTTEGTTTTKLTTEVPLTTSSTEKTITTEHLTTNVMLNTTNMFTTHSEHVVTTTPTLSVTNNTYTTTTSATNADENSTVNTADTKFPDVTNPKHVLINLTISADDAESSSFKQLYSLTLTVPTVGDSNEIPTVKVTPMDAEPTQASNFNKPITLEGSTKVNKPTDDDSERGGSCECSCPACISNATDDMFYDEATENGPTTASSRFDSSTVVDQISSTDQSNLTESTTEDLTKSSGTTEAVTFSTDSTSEASTEISTPEETISTTDEPTTETTTETELSTTTESPKCVCPKIQPPPILILEGEVDLQ